MNECRQQAFGIKTGIGRSGFTLVELLVVIAIIALLVSIIIPTLGKARNRASSVTSMNNLRQIYTAMTMYNDDLLLLV
jgi:prepilin-type N-terminal cleavage/methylation domain-containing protein